MYVIRRIAKAQPGEGMAGCQPADQNMRRLRGEWPAQGTSVCVPGPAGNSQRGLC